MELRATVIEVDRDDVMYIVEGMDRGVMKATAGVRIENEGALDRVEISNGRAEIKGSLIAEKIDDERWEIKGRE